MLKKLILTVICLFASIVSAAAQSKAPAKTTETAASQASKKSNQRPAAPVKPALIEPFEKATVETMAQQCVKFDTEAGIIELEMFPESAPQTVRSFLNLVAAGAFDTTTFSRVVPNFVIQGGDFSTLEKLTPELSARANRRLPDEPNQIKHERGIVSMARSDEPNSATTSFFILVGEAHQLDGKFAAFGRVTSGMETVDAINKMPVEGEKPTKPVHIKHATVAVCRTSSKS